MQLQIEQFILSLNLSRTPNPRSFNTMGHTLPSTTQIAFEQIAELRPLYDALRRSDQLILDKFFEAILQHRAAIGNAANLLPMEIMPFVILLEERKRNERIQNELYALIEGLEKRLDQLPLLKAYEDAAL